MDKKDKAARLKEAKERLARFKDKDYKEEPSPKSVAPAVAPKKAPPPVAAKPPQPSKAAVSDKSSVSSPPASVRSPAQTAPASSGQSENTQGDLYDENLSYEERSRLRRERRAREKAGVSAGPASSQANFPKVPAKAPAAAAPQSTNSAPFVSKQKPPPPPIKPKSFFSPNTSTKAPVDGKPKGSVMAFVKAAEASHAAATSPVGPKKVFNKGHIESVSASPSSSATSDSQTPTKSSTPSQEKEDLAKPFTATKDSGSSKSVGDPSNEDLIDTMASMSMEITSLTEERDTLRKDLQIAKQSNTLLETEVAKLKSNASADTISLNSAKESQDQINSLTEENQSLKAKVTELTASRKSELEAAEHKDMESHEKSVHIRKLEIEGKVLSEENDKLREQIDELQTFRAKKDEYTAASGEHRKVASELSHAKESELAAIQERDRIAKELEEAQAELVLQRENATLVQQSNEVALDSIELQHKQEIEKLNSDIAALQSQVSDSAAPIQATADVDHIDASLRAAAERVPALEAELAEAKAAAAASSDLAMLETMLSDLKIENDAKQAEYVEEIARLTAELTSGTKGTDDRDAAERISELEATLEQREEDLRYALIASKQAEGELDDVLHRSSLMMESSAKTTLAMAALNVTTRNIDIIPCEKIGMKVEFASGLHFIEALQTGGVAERSGLHVNDVVLEVGNISTADMSKENFISIFHKLKGSDFTVKVASLDAIEEQARRVHAGEIAQLESELVQIRQSKSTSPIQNTESVEDLIAKLEERDAKIILLQNEMDALRKDLDMAEARSEKMLSTANIFGIDASNDSGNHELKSPLSKSSFAKILEVLRKQHTSFLYQIEEWKAGDRHVHELSLREEQVRHLLLEAKNHKVDRARRGLRVRSGAHSAVMSSNRAGRPPSSTSKRPKASSTPARSTVHGSTPVQRIATSEANTMLKLAGLTPIGSRHRSVALNDTKSQGYMGYFDHINPNQSYSYDAESSQSHV